MQSSIIPMFVSNNNYITITIIIIILFKLEKLRKIIQSSLQVELLISNIIKFLLLFSKEFFIFNNYSQVFILNLKYFSVIQINDIAQ